MGSATMEPIRRSPRGRVVSWVTRAIRAGDLVGGSPVPSERTLAECLQVSRITVKAALDDLQRAGLVEQPAGGRIRRVAASTAPTAAPANSLVLANTVAILGAGRLPGRPPANWDSSIQYTVSQMLEDAGHHVLAVNSRAPDAGDLGSLVAMKPLGVLLTYNAAESERGQAMIAECQVNGVPVVAYGDEPALANVDRVNSDHDAGAYELTRHLISRSRKRLLRLWRFTGEHHWLDERSRGFERAVAEHGLELLPALRTPDLSAGDVLDAEGFAHVVRMLAGYLSEFVLGATPIDGLMVATDVHAIQAAAALRLLGKTPGREVLIVGYDNSYADYTDFQLEPTPPAATMDKGNTRIARELVSLLLDRVADRVPAEPQRRMVKPSLIVPEQQNTQSETASVSRSIE